MAPPLRKLTIVAPRRLQDTMADCLMALHPQIPGFTICEAYGRGRSIALASAAEQVRGAMRAVMLIVILPEPEVRPALSALADACPVPQLSYWVESVHEFGRLA